MTQIEDTSAKSIYGNMDIRLKQTNPVTSDIIQQSNEQLNYKYIVQIIPDYTPFAIKDDWRDYKECLCYDGAKMCVKEIVDDPKQHKTRRVRIVVIYQDSSLDEYIKEHIDDKGNLKPKSVTLSQKHIV